MTNPYDDKFSKRDRFDHSAIGFVIAFCAVAACYVVAAIISIVRACS